MPMRSMGWMVAWLLRQQCTFIMTMAQAATLTVMTCSMERPAAVPLMLHLCHSCDKPMHSPRWVKALD